MTTTFLAPKNNANGKLNAAITDVATSLTLQSGEGARFPSTFPFNITIDNEILKCTNRSTDTLTVTRAQESTSAAAHSAGATVALNITAKHISDLNSAVNTAETKLDTIETNAVALATVKADADIADAITKKHANTLDHSNALDHSNSLDHAQNEDQYLDQGGANEVGAAAVKSAVDSMHDKMIVDTLPVDELEIAAGNGITQMDSPTPPLNPTKLTVGLSVDMAYIKADADIDDAIDKKHSNTLDHANTNDPTADQKAALAGTSGTPSGTNKYVTNDDSRNSDTRVNVDKSARVTHSVNQSINDSSGVDLAFDTERFDTDTTHDTVTNNSRLTCKTAGKYLIIGMVEWAANATGRRAAYILHNGATTIAQVSVPATLADVFIQQVSCIYELAVNDYVTLGVFQTSGGALNVVKTNNRSPEFMMIKIA